MKEQEKRNELEQSGKQELWAKMQASGLSREGAIKVWEKIHTEDSEMFMSALWTGDATGRNVDHKALHAAIEDFFFKVGEGVRKWQGEINLNIPANPFAKCNQKAVSFPPAPKIERSFVCVPKCGLSLDGAQDEYVKSLSGEILDELLVGHDARYQTTLTVKSDGKSFLYGDEADQLYRHLERKYQGVAA